MSEIARRRSIRSLALVTALGALLAPARAIAEEAEEAEEDHVGPHDRVVHDVGTALFTVGLDLQVAGRRFTYRDALSANLRDYHLSAAPMPALRGEVYPAATTRSALRDLGITVGYARAFGLASDTPEHQRVDTSWDSVDAGLRARFRPAAAEGAVLGLHGGANLTRFTFASKDPRLTASAPSVAYRALRAGVDARIPFGRAALLLDASYDGAISAGPVEARFRGPRVGGVDLGAGLTFALTRAVELRFSGTYLRYFYAFHPIPGDAYVAGGALDELWRLGLGASYAY